MTGREFALEATWAILQEHAAAGTRCPTADGLAYELEKRGVHIQGSAALVPELARAGKIRIEVSDKNWRVVEICEGLHQGKRTAGPPRRNATPYLIIDRNGSHYPKRRLTRAA